MQQDRSSSDLTSMDNFSVEIASVPDRERLVAEVFFGNTMIAELNTETGELLIELYPRPDGEPWKMDAERFLAAVVRAKERLIGGIK